MAKTYDSNQQTGSRAYLFPSCWWPSSAACCSVTTRPWCREPSRPSTSSSGVRRTSPTRVDARLHRIERAGGLRHRRCAVGPAGLASGTQTFARRGSRALLRLGRRLVAARKRHPALRRSVAAAAGVVQHLPHSGRYRRGTGLGRVSDVHRRNLAREDPRHARLVQPVRHHLRHAGRLLRQLPDPQPAGRHGRSHSGRHGLHRLAQDVPQRSVPRGDISAADPLCARNPALPDPHRPRSEGIAGAHAQSTARPRPARFTPKSAGRYTPRTSGSSPTAQR